MADRKKTREKSPTGPNCRSQPKLKRNPGRDSQRIKKKKKTTFEIWEVKVNFYQLTLLYFVDLGFLQI